MMSISPLTKYPSMMVLLLYLYLCILSLALPGSNASSGFSRRVKSLLHFDATAHNKMKKSKYSLTSGDLVANPGSVVGGFAGTRKRLQRKTSTSRQVFFGDRLDDKYGVGMNGPGIEIGGNPTRRGTVPLTGPYSLNKRRIYSKTSSVFMQNTQNKFGRSDETDEKITDEKRDRGRLVASSSISAGDMMGGAQMRVLQNVANVDVGYAGIIAAYVCTQIAVALPVILIPMIAADPFVPGAIVSSPPVNSAIFVGQIVAISSLGGGIGKVMNGFICKAIGGRIAGSLYMLGLAFFSLVLSTTSSIHGYAIAGMEFCASIMWTATSVLMANRFENDPPRFTTAITALSLASTGGALIAKTFGGVLLSMFHWRKVCLFATFAALAGSAFLFFLVREVVEDNKSDSRTMVYKSGSGGKSTMVSSNVDRKEGFLEGMVSSISNVVTKPMFWLLGFAHFCSFIVRSSDKVLGTFIFDATKLPRNLCGPLTMSVTLGFIGGLVTGKKIQDFESIEVKKQFVFNRYAFAILSAIGLAVCGNPDIIGFAGENGIMGQYGLAGTITILSGLLAASVGFQFYQFPPKYSTTFGRNKAVYISFTDACGFLLLSPFWSSVGNVVATNDNGWTISWLTVATFLAAGGAIHVNRLPTILRMEEGKKR